MPATYIYVSKSGLSYFKSKCDNAYQPKLVSGTNIKTINGQSILGSGNLVVGGSGTTKYHHHITVTWSGTSGGKNTSGTLTFVFEDTTSTPYNLSGRTTAQLMQFIETHCNLTGGSSVEEYYPMSGHLQAGSYFFYVDAIANQYGSWYIIGMYFGSSIFADASEYFWNWVAENGISIHDTVL